MPVVFEVGEMFEHIVGRDLAAQMKQVLGTQPAFRLCRLDGIGHLAHLAMFEAAVLVRTHAQAVEHRGNA